MKKPFIEQLENIYPQMVTWRRYLHQNPELSYHEEHTAHFIAELLRSWGIDVLTHVGGHGVVGIIRGRQSGPTVALRADMDALAIQDEKLCDYSSKVPGVMHACGHDAHTAILLGIAYTASHLQEQLQGNLVFVFQPAEEITPGGALAMIRDGVLAGVDVIYGVHLWTPYPVGHIYAREGAMMAAADEFTITIKGKGGHGGLPHQTIDSIAIASHLVVNLQSIVSRHVDPTKPCVISVGSIQGGSVFNVIAETCQLKGTVRTFDALLRIEVKSRIEQMIASTCAMFNATYEWECIWGYPTLVNHVKEVQRFHEVGARLLGESFVHDAPLIMAAEDFSYYIQKVPGCFMFVGAGNEQLGIETPHHHPMFDIDETAMRVASQLLLSMALHYMESK
jgi:amidohydrolase